MSDRLFYIGITHESAPLAIRESLRPDAAQREAILARLAPIAAGRLVLSTCERFELYAMTGCTDTAVWARQLAHWFHLPVVLVARHVQTRQGPSAARHLLRVAAGLESRIVGEAQILGQVRDAVLLAQSTAALDPHLAALGRAAITTGKRVRSQTTLNSEACSIATIALDHLNRLRGPLHGAPVLLLGTGSLASVVAGELIRRRVGSMTLAGRNHERGQWLAGRHNAAFQSLDLLPALLRDHAVVIACTASPTYILHPSMIPAGGDFALVDLSVPRNIDPEVARVPGVCLWDIDRLLAGQPFTLSGVTAANAIVEEQLARFLRWSRERRAAAQISALVRDTVERPHEIHRRIARLKAEAAA